jgi:hypothetical protein
MVSPAMLFVPACMSTTPTPPPPKTPWPEILLAALPALFHALWFLGRLHPDEVFQSLEVGLNKAFGFGVLAWEWQVPPNPATHPTPWGIRNWAVPSIIAGLLRAGEAVGVSSVMGRRALVAVPQVALHAAMLAATWRLAARRVGPSLARAALWLVALYGPLVWFGARTMSESLSVAFLVWGLERLDDERGGRAGWALGGALLGFAQVARYGSAAVIAPAMLWLLVTRRWGPLGWATLGGLSVGAGLGLLDFLTWGEWFHSFIHYVRFNVLSPDAARQFGATPWWSYLPRLLVAPFAVVGLGTWGKHREGRVGLFAAAALGYLGALSATAHKEDRFLYPTLVLLTVAAAPGFVAWAKARWDAGGGGRALAGALALAGAAFFVAPTPFDVQRKEQFQLTVKASKEATGFVLMNDGLWGSGGFFYLGRNLPWCPCDTPGDPCFQMAARDARFNRAVYWSNQDPAEGDRDARSEAAFVAAGFRLVERRGAASYFER